MRSRKKRGWLIAVGVVVVVLGLGLLFRQAIGRFALDRALEALAKSINGRIEYDRLTGDVFAHPRFENVVVVFDGDSVKARELTCKYDPFGFVRGRIPLSEVEVVEPRVYLAARKPVPDAAAEEVADTTEYPKLNLRRLHITGGQFHLDGELRVDSIELTLNVRSNPDELRARLSQAKGRLVQEQVRVREIRAQCRLTTDSLILDSLAVLTSGSRLSGDFKLMLDGSGLAGQVENVSIDLSEFLSQPGRVWARGTGEIQQGKRSGDLEYAAEGLRFKNIRLPVLRGRLSLDDPSLSLEVAGSDALLGEFNLKGTLDIDRLVFHGRAGLRGIRVRSIEPSLPDVKMDADIRFGGKGTDSISVALGASSAELGLDTILVSGVYGSGRAELDRFEIQGPGGWLWLAGSYQDGRVQVKCVMDSLDLGLVARFAGMEAEGRLSGVFSGRGTVDSFKLAGGIRAAGAKAEGVEFERGLAEFDLTIARQLSGRLVIGAEMVKVGGLELNAAQLVFAGSEFDLRIDRAKDRLLALGDIRLRRDGVECDVNTLQFASQAETLLLAERFSVVWSKDSVRVRRARFEVADGMVEIELSQTGKAQPRVDIRGNRLNLRKLQKLFSIPTEMWGTIDFALQGQDTFALTLAGKDVEIPGMEMVLKALDLELALTRSEARVEHFWFVHAIDTTVIKGTVAYDLPAAFGGQKGKGIPLDSASRRTTPGFVLNDVNLELDVADPGVWVLGFLKPTLELEEGLVYAKLVLQGDLSEPNLDGRVRVVRGKLFIPAMNTTVERVNAELTAKGNRIVLEKLSGGAGKGIVTATGFIDFGKDWQVDSLRYRIKPDGAAISPMPEVYAVVGGEVSLGWAPARPLSIDGSIDVEEALLGFGFGRSAVGTGGESDSIVYDIRVKGERGIWLRNQMVDIELSGDLSLRRTMSGEVYSGHLASRQGNVYYLDHTLRVSRGVISFDNISRLNPSLDIVAELPVRSRAGNGTAPDKIILALRGTLEKPEFEFGSEPPGWDENEIITYLNLNVTTEELSALENREMVTKYLSERFLGYLQTRGTKWARKFIGLDELRFESEFAGSEGNKVTVGKYVGPDLYVTYTQNFTGEMQPAFRVEYYLNRKNEIVGERSEGGRYSVRYRFKLRY